MSEQERTAVSGNSGDRVLDFDAILLHNNHLQGGFRKAKRCKICRSSGGQGLASIMEAAEKIVAVDQGSGVAASDGGDKAVDAALPSDSGPDKRGEADQLLEFFLGDKEVS